MLRCSCQATVAQIFGIWVDYVQFLVENVKMWLKSLKFGRAMKLQKSSDSDWPSTNDEVKCNQLRSATRQCVLNFWAMTSKANKIGCSNKLHFLIQPMSQYNSSTVLLQPISNSWAEKSLNFPAPVKKVRIEVEKLANLNN